MQGTPEEHEVVLRWCLAHEPRVRVSLGNHDLHVLGADLGLRTPKGRDTLQDILQAADRDELVAYLARQPFLHEDGDVLMTHAGWPPRWSLEELRARAAALHAAISGPDRRALVEAFTREDPEHPLRDLGDAAIALTCMRTVDEAGHPVYGFRGPLDEVPAGEVAWFDAPGRHGRDRTVVCGHWAALGLFVRDDVIALDSGCVWGGALTAIRLEDRQIFQVPA